MSKAPNKQREGPGLGQASIPLLLLWPKGAELHNQLGNERGKGAGQAKNNSLQRLEEQGTEHVHEF